MPIRHQAIVPDRFRAGFPAAPDIREFGTPKAAAYPDLRNRDHRDRRQRQAVNRGHRGSVQGRRSRIGLACTTGSLHRGRESRCPKSMLGLLPGAGELSGCRVYSALNPHSI